MNGVLIWYSQRDDWGHLYLYDLASGKLKHQITSGEGPVSQIARLDEKAAGLLEFYDATSGLVFGFVLRVTGDRASAEEVLVEIDRLMTDD